MLNPEMPPEFSLPEPAGEVFTGDPDPLEEVGCGVATVPV